MRCGLHLLDQCVHSAQSSNTCDLCLSHQADEMLSTLAAETVCVAAAMAVREAAAEHLTAAASHGQARQNPLLAAAEEVLYEALRAGANEAASQVKFS